MNDSVQKRTAPEPRIGQVHPIDLRRIHAIAKVLLEPNVGQMCWIAAVLGMDAVEDIYDRTLDIEISGGLSTQNGARRRSSGGVFFHLARQQMNAQQRRQAFCRRSGANQKNCSRSSVL